MAEPFDDRRHAGRVLAERLAVSLAPRSGDAVVLALPRGGVPVAYEVATRFGLPIEVFVVRKLGVPGHEELAMGAIASGGTVHLNRDVVDAYRITEADIRQVVDAEQRELARREAVYRSNRPLPELRDRTVVIVDDGLATGSTMQAAVAAVRTREPSRIVVAVPTGAAETCASLAAIADDVVCAVTPRSFHAVGQWYRDFSQTSDAEVTALLAALPVPVRVDVDGVVLDADLTVPPGAAGVVLFAHGSGSSRHSPRNQAVAGALRDGGLGTMLADLLTSDEERLDERGAALRFDIGLLATRLVAIAEWLAASSATAECALGLFGASTGGGAALVAAARRPDLVEAVVSRGGRPDLAGDALGAVRAPTLLVVGGRDETVLDVNRAAAGAMVADVRLEIVPGASHLFEEPGALDDVARLACRWFVEHLGRRRAG